MKKWKIWLGVFLGLFAIPEILWSPISNFYVEFYQGSKYSDVNPWRDNFLQNSDNIAWLKFVILIQLIGSLLFFYNFLKNRNILSNPVLRWFLVLVFSCLLILTAFAAYYAYGFNMEIL